MAGISRWSIALAAWALSACAGPLPEPAPVPPSLSNTVRWSTASESDNFGFDVYRALDRDGPWQRITEQPIPGGGTTDLPRRYRFEDTGIEPGVAYFYYVESISLGGRREAFTPIMAAPPKPPPEN